MADNSVMVIEMNGSDRRCKANGTRQKVVGIVLDFNLVQTGVAQQPRQLIRSRPQVVVKCRRALLMHRVDG